VLLLLTVLGARLILYGIVLGGLALRMQRLGHASGSGAGA
jgi:hypothetical protein